MIYLFIFPLGWERSLLESGILNCSNTELDFPTVSKIKLSTEHKHLALRKRGLLRSLKIPVSFLRLSCEEA